MRNKTIDLVKYIASIMIVAIHTGLFSDVDDTLCFVTIHILCRQAVPFFAISTGYFLSKQVTFDSTLEKTEYNNIAFLIQWRKLLRLYAVWTVVYLFHSIPMWFEIGWFSPFAFVDYAIGAITKGSHYHFWYLWGMIYTLPAFYLLLRMIRGQHLPALVAGLWLMKAVSYGYVSWLPESVQKPLQSAGTFLCLLPLLLTGAVIARKPEESSRLKGVGFAISALALTVEAFWLRSYGQEAVSYVFFTLPTAYHLFCFLLRINVRIPAATCKKMGAASAFVYCVHPILVETIGKLVPGGTLRFLIVAFGAVVLSVAYIKINTIIRKKCELCSN